MPNTKKEVRQRVLIRTFGDLGIVGPALVSLGLGLGAILMHLNPVMLGVSTLAGLGAASKLAWNLYRTEQITRDVYEDMQEELEAAREKELDELDRRCSQDDDPSDEDMLRELRELNRLFKNDHSWMREMDKATVLELESAAEELFQACVTKIEMSLDLRDQARRLPRSAARGLVETRRELLRDVEQGVEGLGELFSSIQKRNADRMAGRASMTVGDVRGIMDRFQHIMDLDQRVQERMGREFRSERDRA